MKLGHERGQRERRLLADALGRGPRAASVAATTRTGGTNARVSRVF